MKKLIPLEIDEQAAVVEYLELLKKQGKIVLFSALPNNTYTKSWSQRRKQVREGVRKGVPDLLIVTPRRVFFLELKRQGRGVASPEQLEWDTALNCTGVSSRICKGFEGAKEWIDLMIKNQTVF